MRSPSVDASTDPIDRPPELTEALWLRVMGEVALYRDRYASSPLMTVGKPLGVLAFLALAPGRAADRDLVAELLWPDADPRERHHSLRQCRYRIRAITGDEELLQLDGNNLRLSSAVELDCLAGESAEDPATAWRLLKGTFLAGFGIPESREFEEWAESQRARFGERRTRAGLGLASLALERGDPEGALEIAEEVAVARPFDDEPMLLVLRSLAATGGVATALSRYAAYVDLLEAQEYEPEDDLSVYAAELRRLARERSSQPRTELPFVGRSGESSMLERHWEEATRGRGRIALIEGGAGLGKSRVLRETHARVRAAGGLVLAAKCYEPEMTVPYAAITDALAAAVGDPATAALPTPWLAELSKLLPEIRELDIDIPSPSAGRGSPAAKRRLHQAVLRLLSALGGRSPILFTIDDVQWADTASLEILHFLARKVGRSPVLMLLTYRPAELSPDSRRLTRSLAAGRLADLIALEPLSQDDVRELLGRMATFDKPGAEEMFSRNLHRISGGNPLFLEELLEALGRKRILWVQDGRWSWEGNEAEPHLPRTIGKLLADRFEVLDRGTRACLELAAVVADDVSPQLLARALALSEPRTEIALLILEDNRLIRRLETGDFAISHDELRRMVYQMIPDERRRTLHQSIAEVMESLDEAKRPGGTARLAYHFAQASVRKKARRYALEAAEEAAALSAEDQGRTQLRAAAALADRPLAPGDHEAGPTRLVLSRRRMVFGAAALFAGLVSAAGLLLWPTAGPGVYHQGTLYLSAAAGGKAAQVEWTRHGGVVRTVDSRSWDQPELLFRSVSEDGETHNKLFVTRGGDAIQLTTGMADDLHAEWAPDGESMFLTRGWRASDDLYVASVFRLDSQGRVQERVTRSRGQDHWVTVSPRGTALAVVRDSGGISSVVLMGADGSDPWNLSETFDLPRIRTLPAFSPDGTRIAFAYGAESPAAGDLYVIDLRARLARKIFSFDGIRSPPRLAWSPDGRWIALVRTPHGQPTLTILPEDGSGPPVEIERLPGGLLAGPWHGGSARYVERVRLYPNSLTLPAGSGRALEVHVRDIAGRAIHDERIRFVVSDSTVARVDVRGYVVGRAPGTTVVTASAGGFRSDTINLSVSYAAVDTLFVESWAAGLDTTVWELFGSPRPKTVQTGHYDRRTVFFNNGDYNHGSGAISSMRFDARGIGLTVEAEAWVPLTYNHWQHWQLGVVAGEPRYFAKREFHELTAALGIDGDTPVFGSPRWVCAGAGGPEDAGVWEPRDRWIRFSLQVRADGRVECFEDGVLLGSLQLNPSTPLEDLAVVLRGQSVGTDIFHGRVVVTSGLRY
jgi:DNA-binding SARP family transcriptional activator